MNDKYLIDDELFKSAGFSITKLDDGSIYSHKSRICLYKE